MSSTVINLPTSDYVEAVKESCKNCELSHADTFKVNKEALEKFSQEISLEEIQDFVNKTVAGLPLKFDNLEEELNVTVLINLLNFGSGYRENLKKSFQRGAADTILYGVMSMHLGGISMSADSLSQASSQLVSDWFSLPLKQEEPHPEITGLYVYNPTPFASLVDKLTEVINETGNTLKNLGYRNLGHCILELSKSESNPDALNDDTSPYTASEYVEKLVKTFKSLQDIGIDGNGTPIYIFKRAQLITADLYLRYKDVKPKNFNFKNYDQLTIFADNVIPTMLIHFGIITPPQEVLSNLENGQKTNDENMLILRAISISVVEDLVILLNSTRGWNVKLNSSDLDRYIWQLAKKPELRKLNRLLNTSNVYY